MKISAPYRAASFSSAGGMPGCSATPLAIASARPGDVVLLTGKGHEDYQEIKGVKYHFDDAEVVTEILEQFSKN